MKVATIAKAVTAGLAAGLLVFDLACDPSSAGDVTVTAYEWVRVAVSTAIAGLAVYAVPNELPGTEKP